jgi:hypothetical protein
MSAMSAFALVLLALQLNMEIVQNILLLVEISKISIKARQSDAYDITMMKFRTEFLPTELQPHIVEPTDIYRP